MCDTPFWVPENYFLLEIYFILLKICLGKDILSVWILRYNTKLIYIKVFVIKDEVLIFSGEWKFSLGSKALRLIVSINIGLSSAFGKYF